MTEEIWRPVVGYEGLYEVSNTGRVRSLDRYDSRNHLRKGELMNFFYGCGYLKVVFSKNGIVKKYLVHRLVAQAFIPNPDNLPQVNHKDENKTNNNVDNLEWCDSKYNNNYGTIKQRRRETLIKIGQYKTGLSRKDLGNIEYGHQYYQKNKDKAKEYKKKYYQENKEKILIQKKEYYQENKEKILIQKKEHYKEYYQENKEKILIHKKEYYQENKEKRREYRHQYYLKKKAGL